MQKETRRTLLHYPEDKEGSTPRGQGEVMLAIAQPGSHEEIVCCTWTFSKRATTGLRALVMPAVILGLVRYGSGVGGAVCRTPWQVWLDLG